ncbi:polyketide biosynthesis enoyl-CoA hydratase PksI [Bradyrhizobium sp. USDA 4524]|uniref:polyketide synthase n=1 Tax=unclassified Bradyrhizobium TaxID=2631580 RepID=UPI0020A21F81|nr:MULTISPECIES: polyketide synthase [unclassified Bradyrhizobium]MCP1846020.1 polyketide biosynthesis enoyl-CoA hydratase PksI [Bradyrhizobium sp. USDA 4538]MCP1907346.1 polyketide biosynthesis enoyl-CoA hydratase PksI [Bradyrhizobium sp. USDA 4537]MCP1985132.1 polyketide biosynthesis enoyl-CoA hydratase PksI [Bradyrhizobium sp. USDA 4539]
MTNQTTVDLREIEPGIMLLRMQERDGKNTFTSTFIDGLLSAFDEIDKNMSCKAVILTGYDTYFACGATKELLLALHKGAAKFSDVNLYSRPLECAVPVIAAMQGHGIGGGFVFGLFADIIILGKESLYTANFMKYGFTPGMGASCVVPAKLGTALSAELLLGAGTYSGAELARRGVPFAVLPRSEVVDHAIKIARELALMPRTSLMLLKKHLAAPLRAELPRFIAIEESLHKETICEPEVRDRIEALFEGLQR